MHMGRVARARTTNGLAWRAIWMSNNDTVPSGMLVDPCLLTISILMTMESTYIKDQGRRIGRLDRLQHWTTTNSPWNFADALVNLMGHGEYRYWNFWRRWKKEITRQLVPSAGSHMLSLEEWKNTQQSMRVACLGGSSVDFGWCTTRIHSYPWAMGDSSPILFAIWLLTALLGAQKDSMGICNLYPLPLASKWALRMGYYSIAYLPSLQTFLPLLSHIPSLSLDFYSFGGVNLEWKEDFSEVMLLAKVLTRNGWSTVQLSLCILYKEPRLWMTFQITWPLTFQ